MKLLNSVFAILLAFFVIVFCRSTALGSTWARTYDEASIPQEARSILETADGGFVFAGSRWDSGNHRFWVVKLNSFGEIEWEKRYGDVYAIATSIDSTPTGYIVAGFSDYGTDSNDIWVLNLDNEGNLLWEKVFSTTVATGEINAKSIRRTSDGGFIIGGETSSFGGWKLIVIKLKPSGELEWQKVYDVDGDFNLDFTVVETPPDGYIAAGDLVSQGCAVLKLDQSGAIQWQKRFDDPDRIYNCSSVEFTSDGGFIVAGHTLGPTDVWVLKLNESGQIEWQNIYDGGLGNDSSASIKETADGYALVGNIGTPSDDVWLLKLDKLSGAILLQKAYGGSLPADNDVPPPYGFQHTSDGGYVIAGRTPGSGLAWVLKTDAQGEIDPSCDSIDDSSAVVFSPPVESFDTQFVATDVVIVESLTNGTTADTAATVTLSCGSTCTLVITTTSLPNGTEGQSYNQTLVATGGTTPYTWTILGSLPPGLTLDSATGIISGTPPIGSAGTYNFTAQVTDSAVPPCTDTQALSITIDLPGACGLFNDQFNDGVLDPNYTYIKNISFFSENGNNLIISNPEKKSTLFLDPIFNARPLTCTNCYVETRMSTAGGALNRIWMFSHAQDAKENLVELLGKEENDRWVLKHRINKKVVAKAKAILPIDPNIFYVARIRYDGVNFIASIDGVDIITLSPGGSVTGGSAGVRAKRTVGTFDYICVN